ncbi:hypothetical protein R3P38DRAFT_3234083 [Favolaschia claudopus]|uniref:Uncharacterized protein n=1 Tax=Favolaschia claudopus TaxID=2862362 RepID=A0AAV9ZHA7_9AGAR
MDSNDSEIITTDSIFSGSLIPTIHVSGGVGGPGGRGGQGGGVGGNGEGPQLNFFSSAVVNVRGRPHGLNDFGDQDSQDDFSALFS